VTGKEKRKNMVQFVEMEGKMNRNGCIEVPAAVLEQAGIDTGEAVKLFYMADRESLKNESREFMIFRADEGETAGKQEISFQIPQELLKDAGIPLGADLDIVCQNQKIIIMPEQISGEVEVPEELLALCGELGISKDKVRIILRTTEEGKA
jgi:antitoxin component of MazEF toxin-antitoxin module